MKLKNKISAVEFELRDQTLFLKNALKLGNVEEFTEAVIRSLKSYSHKTLEINLDQIEDIDSVGVATLTYLKNLMQKKRIETSISGGQDHVKKKIEIFSFDEKHKIQKKSEQSLFEYIGEGVDNFIRDNVYSFLVLTANVMFWTVTDIFNQKSQRRGEFYNQAVLIGVNAVWIVGGLALIIGLVLALQSAAQLRNFGANIFIVDLTVIAMMREMGPLITAILVAGRSGSSIAAEIATMKVTSELDALKTMALNPVRFAIIPKMHGSIVTIPFLTILANLMGILGGMVIACLYLDIAPEVFINRMGQSLYSRDLIIGVFKSLVFAIIIVLTGSYLGLRVEQGAEGVGKVTTLAVVISISLVIVADSIMGLIFY